MNMNTTQNSLARDVAIWVLLHRDAWRCGSFRSAVLLPNLVDDEYKRIFGSSTFSIDEAKAMISVVIENRKALVKQSLASSERVDTFVGRFLQHNFQETTYSCTPQEETEGFFDSLDIPPWDFWVGIKTVGRQHFLYSWIPTPFVELVDRGVRCSAEENILWLKEEPIM